MCRNNSKPLDIKKFKEIVQQESARLNLRSFSDEGESFIYPGLGPFRGREKNFL